MVTLPCGGQEVGVDRRRHPGADTGDAQVVQAAGGRVLVLVEIVEHDDAALGLGGSPAYQEVVPDEYVDRVVPPGDRAVVDLGEEVRATAGNAGPEPAGQGAATEGAAGSPKVSTGTAMASTAQEVLVAPVRERSVERRRVIDLISGILFRDPRFGVDCEPCCHEGMRQALEQARPPDGPVSARTRRKGRSADRPDRTGRP